MNLDPALIGTVSTLAGALLGGVITLILNLHAARAQRSRDRAQHAFERREKRYAERRDAYSHFIATVDEADDGATQMEARDGLLPGDQGYEPPHPKILKARDALVLLASSEVVKAAHGYEGAFYEWAYEGKGHDEVAKRRQIFIDAARRDLEVE